MSKHFVIAKVAQATCGNLGREGVVMKNRLFPVFVISSRTINACIRAYLK